METCKNKLKTFRQGDPFTCQRIWDAIKQIRVDRKAANLRNVVSWCSKSFNVEQEYLEQQIELLVHDKLLVKRSSPIVKGSNKGDEQIVYCIPLESEMDLMSNGSHDWYCFNCHKPGPVMPCKSCPKVYHVGCFLELEEETEFICPHCQEKVSQIDGYDRSKLNKLLSFACFRLEGKFPFQKYIWDPATSKAISNAPFTTDRCAALLKKIPNKPNSSVEDESWREKFLLRFRNVSLQKMIDRADVQVYQSLSHFRLDTATIVHNVAIFSGAHSLYADSARVMYRDCLRELKEIELCSDCYIRSNQQEEDDWFCEPCEPRHKLVYAKAKGFPYWPAKVLKVSGKLYDVRFFGSGHDRLTVDESYIRQIDCNINSLVPKKSSGWVKAMEELKKHQLKLEETSSDKETGSEIGSEAEEMNEEPEVPDIGNKSPIRKVVLSRKVWVELCRVPRQVSNFKETPENQNVSSVSSLPSLSATSNTEATNEPSASTSTSSLMLDSTFLGRVALLEKELDSCKKSHAAEIITHDEELKTLKETHAAEIEIRDEELKTLKETHAAEIETRDEELKTLKETHAAEIETRDEELKTLKKTHDEELRTLKESFEKQIEVNKSKVWCSNNCGEEGILHCCIMVSYCSHDCQQIHWKFHRRLCKREREGKRSNKGE